ncbi:MAG TPA: ABC transporter substrate-binding protein [Egibacteraceae bacterium]|nr:ABC transporter substrate-binding protein [Egibacteraceae bacterium]
MHPPTRTPARWLTLLLALAMAAAACNGGEDAPDLPGTGEAPDGGEVGGEFSMASCEPQNLLPTNSTEVCGSQVLSYLFTALVEYDAETGDIDEGEGVAESIDSDDQTNWTITLRDDFTFHNGDPVTAQSFVDAWNWMADPDNAQAGVDFLESASFEGLEEVQNGEAEEMSGVTAVDETTIEVALSEPFSPFPQMMGYTAFYPLPGEFYDDPEGFEDAPVGNGPYMMDGEWERGQQIRLARYEDYPGEGGNADAVEIRIYDDAGTAYRDLQAGNLDVLAGVQSVPPEQIAAAEAEFGDNFLETESSAFTYIGFPMYDPAFSEDVNLRRALSLAIDRELIIETIFQGANQPATAVIPPVLEAHRPDACEYCEHDPEQAQELYEQTDGVEEPLTLYFNSGAGHEEWMEAVANQLRSTLGIQDIQFESLEFAEYLDLLDAQEVDGPFRLGWVLSYLSPQYSLLLYESGADSNNFGYASEEFDELYRQGTAAETTEEAEELFQQAEDVLLEDLPLIPMWYSVYHHAHADRVGNVIVDARTFLRVTEVEVVD